jgi:hypothetical protein
VKYTVVASVLFASLVLVGCEERSENGAGPTGASIYIVRPDSTGDFPTIQAAIYASVDSDTIELTNGVFTGEGNMDIGYLGKAIVVRSQSGIPDSCIIDCQGAGRGFYFRSNETASSVLAGVTIRNASADKGAGIRCTGSSPSVRQCIITLNHAENDGGGVYCWGSSPDFAQCTISHNSTPSYSHGGGVSCYYSSSPTFTDCTIDDNDATYGAGVYCFYSSPSFISTTITRGEGSGDGAGVYCYASCSPTFVACSISNNRVWSSSSSGGGVYCRFSSPSFVQSTISDNASYMYGGGVCCSDTSSPSFTECTISGNETNFGGGVYCSESSPTFNQCTIMDNEAAPVGGGVYCVASSPEFVQCTIRANAADAGGGVFCENASSLKFTECEVSNNRANHLGGGVSCSGSSPVFMRCSVVNNWTYERCGGVLCGIGSSPRFIQCTISNNMAASEEGGVYCQSASPIFNSTIISFSQGAGIYLENSPACTLVYCDIFGNSSGDIVGSGPLGLGILADSNTNGDSCDIYFNIFLDPMFSDTSTQDYQLQVASPCIDAGNPALPLDPDGSVTDIGAFYFH